MNFKEIVTNSTKIFLHAMSKSWILFIGIASMNFLYQHIISIMTTDTNKLQLSILIYNVILYPFIMLFIMFAVKEQLTLKDLFEKIKPIIKESQRCYGRLLIYYTIIVLAKVFMSFSTNFLLLLIIIVKFPFIESFIFFNNKSLPSSIKTSFECTQNSVLKVTLCLSVLFVATYWCIIKLTSYIYNLTDSLKIVGFLAGLLTANIEIITKIIIISIFLCINKSQQHVTQTA